LRAVEGVGGHAHFAHGVALNAVVHALSCSTVRISEIKTNTGVAQAFLPVLIVERLFHGF
jgi:hypothetical protein